MNLALEDAPGTAVEHPLVDLTGAAAGRAVANMGHVVENLRPGGHVDATEPAVHILAVEDRADLASTDRAAALQHEAVIGGLRFQRHGGGGQMDRPGPLFLEHEMVEGGPVGGADLGDDVVEAGPAARDRKGTTLNSSH